MHQVTCWVTCAGGYIFPQDFHHSHLLALITKEETKDVKAEINS